MEDEEEEIREEEEEDCEPYPEGEEEELNDEEPMWIIYNTEPYIAYLIICCASGLQDSKHPSWAFSFLQTSENRDHQLYVMIKRIYRSLSTTYGIMKVF